MLAYGDLLIEDLEFSYRPHGWRLDIETLRISAGERVAIVGSVGSGKSTLIKLLAGKLTPTRGNIWWGPRPMQSVPPYLLQTEIAFVGTTPEQPCQASELPWSLQSSEVWQQALITEVEQLGLEIGQLVCDSHGNPELDPAHLSEGQRQLLNVAQASLRAPSMLLLDEPTRCMNPGLAERCIEHVCRRSNPTTTVVLATHDYSLLENVDRLIVLSNGTISFDGSFSVPSRTSTPAA